MDASYSVHTLKFVHANIKCIVDFRLTIECDFMFFIKYMFGLDVYIGMCTHSFICAKKMCARSFYVKTGRLSMDFYVYVLIFSFPVFNARTLYMSLQKFIWIDSAAVKASHKMLCIYTFSNVGVRYICISTITDI